MIKFLLGCKILRTSSLSAVIMDQSCQKNIQELHANRERSLVAEALIDMSHLSSTEDVTHVPRSSGVLSADEIEWTEQYDVTALVDLLVTQKVKAVDLLHAFRKRATLAQQLVSHTETTCAESL